MSSSMPPLKAEPLISREPPPDTHVHLILYDDDNGDEFYLEIPISVVSDLVVKPHKYLCYLGWCTLGTKGCLLNEQFERVDLEVEELVKGGTYIYDPAVSTLQYAVDLEVIKLRTKYSCSSARNSSFLTALKMRDYQCAFTGLAKSVIGMHIIPHARGDEWIDLIMKNRPGGDRQSEQLETIDDMRNGILVSSNIHSFYDERSIVILKTPNPMLKCEDIKPRSDDRDLFGDVEYPSTTRFTLQWIVHESNSERQRSFYRRVAANNLDAAFVKGTGLAKPSSVLLHYNYGAAVVQHWGRNTTLLTNRADIPRPQTVAEPQSYGPPTARSHYGHVIEKLEGEKATQGIQNLGRDVGHGGAADSNGWEADDVMMFLWGNNPHAVERWNKERRDKQDKINLWRSGISLEQR